MVLAAAEREQVSLLRRHAHAAGGLAQAVADAASPLALSQSLQVAVQSFGVVLQALQALAAVTEVVELDVAQVGVVGRPAGAAVGLPHHRLMLRRSSRAAPHPTALPAPPPVRATDPGADAAAHRHGRPRPRHTACAAQRAPGLGPAHGRAEGAAPAPPCPLWTNSPPWPLLPTCRHLPLRPAGLARVGGGGGAAVPGRLRLPLRLLPLQALHPGGHACAAAPASTGPGATQHHRPRCMPEAGGTCEGSGGGQLSTLAWVHQLGPVALSGPHGPSFLSRCPSALTAAAGQDDVTSPATVQRAQVAVLRCLHTIATCDRRLAIAGVSSSASEALLPTAQPLLVAVGDAMGSRHAAPVREQATQVRQQPREGPPRISRSPDRLDPSFCTLISPLSCSAPHAPGAGVCGAGACRP